LIVPSLSLVGSVPARHTADRVFSSPINRLRQPTLESAARKGIESLARWHDKLYPFGGDIRPRDCSHGKPMPIKVLLADDNETVRKAICRLLTSDPEIHVVAEATSFRQALQIAGTQRPHVVVLDLHMGDEREVTPLQVKSSIGASQLLAISIWNDDEAKALADSFGAVTLLDKISLTAELIPAIKRLANGHEPADLRGEDLLEAD
jgi:CheY-like chemotaxis protein